MGRREGGEKGDVAMGREAMGQKGRKGQERGKVGQGSGGGGRRRTKGREARALGREGTLTQSPAPQGQCQCAQLRWLGDNYSSPGEKNTPSTHETGRSRPTAVSARRGTCAGCQETWASRSWAGDANGPARLIYPPKQKPFLHSSKIFHDRERKQNPTTKTHRFHLAFLIQSLVYAFLVREQSSDVFNGALNAVLGAFHQFFFLKIASLISLNTLISLV